MNYKKMDTVYWGKRRNLCRCVHASHCNTDNWNINGISDEESAEVGESLQEMIYLKLVIPIFLQIPLFFWSTLYIILAHFYKTSYKNKHCAILKLNLRLLDLV